MGFDYGDMIRALCLLKANSNHGSRQAIANALGINLTLAAATAQRASKIADGSKSLPQLTQPTHEQPARAPRPQTNPIPSTLRFLEEAPSENAPAWLQSATVLPKPALTIGTLPPKPSLLTPFWTRGLFVNALATACESGEIDLPKLVAMISSGKAPVALPVVRIPTLARGVQCWIDDGPAMEPYIQDQHQVLSILRQVAGISRVDMRKFRGLPERSGRFVRGAAHLVLSDLGSIQLPETYPAEWVTTEDWVDFATWVRDELEARVIVLTPIPVRNYALPIRNAATLLYWDRKTNVQSVRRAVAGVL